MDLLYLVHDLGDPAVARRVRLLAAGGARVRLAGFTRGGAPPTEAAAVLVLGRTADHRLKDRALSVASRWLAPGELARFGEGAQAVVARNLETLVLGARVRRGRPLVYECLDVHRLMLGSGSASRLLRALERRLLAAARLLVVSSPGFVRGYFSPVQGYAGPARLVENKALRLEGGDMRPRGAGPAPPPWVIGWFGVVRCARSLDLLIAVSEAMGGRLKVLIAGRPDAVLLPDFEAQVAAASHVEFAGPYTPSDLPALYGRTHFAWAIDWYEAGGNSDWLLPNRLYEGPLNGAVPIASAAVETGRWLQERGVGVPLADPEAELSAWLERLSVAEYAGLRAAVAALPIGDLQLDAADGRALVAELAALR